MNWCKIILTFESVKNDFIILWATFISQYNGYLRNYLQRMIKIVIRGDNLKKNSQLHVIYKVFYFLNVDLKILNDLKCSKCNER